MTLIFPSWFECKTFTLTLEMSKYKNQEDIPVEKQASALSLLCLCNSNCSNTKMNCLLQNEGKLTTVFCLLIKGPSVLDLAVFPVSHKCG